jgi:hypothetical protein
MKLYLVILTALLLHCTTRAIAQEKSDREGMNLRGPVQSVRVMEGKAVKESGKWIDDTLKLREFTAFDTKGRLVKSSAYSGSGELKHRWTTAYDDERRMILTTHYHSNGSVSHYALSKLDERGREVEFMQYDSLPNLFDQRIQYEYDEQGRKIGWVEQNRSGNGLQTDVTRVEHHTDGNRSEVIDYGDHGAVRRKEIVIVDTVPKVKGIGMMVRRNQSVYKENGRLDYRTIVAYDSLNRKRIYKFIRDYSIEAPDILQKYNEKGECIDEVKVISAHQKEHTQTRYDDRGNAVHVVRDYYTSSTEAQPFQHVQSDEITLHDIEYDGHGNWIREVVEERKETIGKSQGRPVQTYTVQRREITYFEE